MSDWKRPRPSGSTLKPMPNIWQLQSKRDVEGLMAALMHQEASVRRGAAAALRTLGAWHAVPALQAALNVETDWQTYAALAAAYQYLDRDIHIEALIKNRDVRGLSKMLNSKRPDEIIIACEAIAAIGDRLGVEPLVMVFRNTLLPNKVRLAAAESLLKLDGAPAMVTLLQALRRDDWRIRQNAAAILGQLNAVWATEPLIRSLEDSNLDVVKASLLSLTRLGTPEAIEAVNTYLAKASRASVEAQKLTTAERPSKKDTKMLRVPTELPVEDVAAKPADTTPTAEDTLALHSNPDDAANNVNGPH